MTNFRAPKHTNIKTTLPDNPDQALRELIQISNMLLAVSERETQTLAQDDMVSFAILQDEKAIIAKRYALASEAFRARLEDFRQADRNLVKRLETLQRRISEVSQENNIMVGHIRDNAQKTTQKTLLTVQELAQSRPVTFTPLNTEERA